MITLTHTPAYTTYHPDTFTVADTGLTLTVRPSENASDPRDWFHVDNVALFIYRADPNHHGPEAAPDNDAAREFERVFDLTRDTQAALDAAKAVTNDTYEMETTSLDGYVQGDWVDVFVAVRKGLKGITTRDVAEMFRQWLFGDVYRVTDEESGHTVGGIYADSMEDAVRLYLSNHKVE